LLTDKRHSQIERLRAQNQHLTQLLDHEKVHSANLQDDLVKQISSLLLNFTTAQSQSLATAIEPVMQYNVAGMENLNAFKQDYGTHAQASRDNILRYEEHVKSIQDGYQALRQEGHKVSSRGIHW
jgi:kinesin family protein 11